MTANNRQRAYRHYGYRRWQRLVRQAVRRPLVVLSSAWLCGIVFAAHWQIAPLASLAGALVIGILALCYWQRRARRLLLLALALLCMGSWRYTIAQPEFDPQAAAHAIGPASVIVNGTVMTEPRLSAHARVLTVEASQISPEGENSYNWQPLHGTIEVISSGTMLEDPYGANYGDGVTLYGKLQAPSAQTPAGIQAVMDFPGISVSSGSGNPLLTALYHLRVRCASIIARVLPQPLAALLIAIVLGLRTPALTTLALAFNVTGTAHLIVPSGFKVAIAASLLTNSTRWLAQDKLVTTWRYRRYHWGSWLQTLLVVAGIVCYTILSGAGAAAIRSGVMGCLLILAPRLQRNYNVYTALAFTALLMSLQDPTVLWDTGFLLSFLGTLGIVLFTPTIQRPLHFCHRLPGGQITAENVAVTLAAQLATLPIFAIVFGQLSFIAPIANILTVPLLGILVSLGLLLCLTGLVALPLAQLVGAAVWPILWYVSHIVTLCAALPHAYLLITQFSTPLAWFYYVLLILLAEAYLFYREYRWRHRGKARARTGPTAYQAYQIEYIEGEAKPSWLKRQSALTRYSLYSGALALLAATTVLTSLAQSNASSSKNTTISFLNVGPAGKPPQGEAILIHSADGANVLIDGGPDATSLANILDARFSPWQRVINLAILTDPQAAHLIGLQDAIARYNVDAVIDAGMEHPNATYLRWRRTISQQQLTYTTVGQGQTITPGTQLRLEVLWPPAGLIRSEVVDDSMILRLVLPGLRILLLGSAAQSSYALTQLQQQIPLSQRTAEVVQIVSGTKQLLTPAGKALVQETHPSLLIVTPPSSTAKAATSTGNQTSQGPSLQDQQLSGIREIQTAQSNGLTIEVATHSWTLHSP